MFLQTHIQMNLKYRFYKKGTHIHLHGQIAGIHLTLVIHMGLIQQILRSQVQVQTLQIV